MLWWHTERLSLWLWDANWKHPHEEMKVHHKSQGYLRGWSEKRRIRGRRRWRWWNGDSEDKQILMSNDPLASSAAWEKRQERKADLGKQPFWRWLFMAETKQRTKRWFTLHICMVSCKFSWELKSCLLPIFQWMCVRLSHIEVVTFNMRAQWGRKSKAVLMVISGFFSLHQLLWQEDLLYFAYPSFSWLSYPQSVWTG